MHDSRRLPDSVHHRQSEAAAEGASNRRHGHEAQRQDGGRTHRGCQHDGGGLAAGRAVHPGLFRARPRRGRTQVVRVAAGCPAVVPALRALLATSLLAALGSCAPAGTGAAGPTIIVGTGLAASQQLTRAVDAGGVRSLDPSLSTDVPGERVLDDLFEGLTRLDERGEPAPGVAERWEQSADGRVWTFHLREAHWSNGAPVQAADFVYAWRRTVDPATASDYAQALAAVVNTIAISEGRMSPATLGIEAPDQRTVRVRLNAPTPYLLSLLTKAYAAPQYEPAIRAHGESWVRPENLVNNGAFLLREHVIGRALTPLRDTAHSCATQHRLTRGTHLPPGRGRPTHRLLVRHL